MLIKFKKLHENAQLPVHATEDAAGLDLYACLDEPVTLHPGEAAAVPTGLAMELPHGMEAQIRGRSGLAFKHAVIAFNGTIDYGYRGELKCLLINHSRVPFVIEPNMRICQMVINAAYVKCRPEWAEELEETKRGESGFGSTGYDVPVFEDSSDPYAITEAATHISYDHIPFTELPNKSPNNEDIKAILLMASKGKK